MVMVRAATFGAMFGAAQPRNAFGAKAMQIYGAGGITWSRKATIVRNAPYMIELPTLGQADVRIKFGELASKFKGCTGLVDGLPCVAGNIRRAVRENRETLKSAYARPKSEWRSRQKPSFHTIEDLKVYLRKKRKQEMEVGAQRAPAALATIGF